MRTYEQCLREYKESSELRERLEAERKKNNEDIRAKLTGKSRFNRPPELEAWMEEYKRKKKELDEQLFVLRIEHKIKLHNLKYTMWAECVPIIIEVFGKYAGKQYGPKTREKINKEFSEATRDRFTCGISNGCVWVDSCLLPGRSDVYIEMYIRPVVFENNTITAFSADDLKFPGYRKEFIEDTRNAALELIEQHRKVQGKMKELIAEANKYKDMSVGGMKELPYYYPLSDIDMY